MVTKIYKTALLAIVLGLTACYDNEDANEQSTTGSIAAKIIWGDESIQSKPGDEPILLALVTNPVDALPVDLVTVRLTVEGNGITPITKTFNAADRTGTISGLPANESPSNLLVEGLNGASEVKYRDASTSATVTAGTVTSVNAYARSITQVVSTSPANLETGVSPLAAIRITFDTYIASGVVGGGFVTLTDTLLSTQVPAAVTAYDSGTKTVTFTPTNTLKDNTDYQVTISADLIDAYDNTLQTSFNWEFTTGVALPPMAWSAAELVDGNTGDPTRYNVVLDAAGNALAIWQQSSGTVEDVWANRYIAGVGWGTPETITDGSGVSTSSFTDLSLAVDGGGNALAVWGQFNTTLAKATSRSNRYTAGVGWGTPEEIASDINASLYTHHIAFDSNDDAVVVGSYYTLTSDSFWSNRYTAGSGWGAFEYLPASTSYGYRSKVSFDVANNAIMIWSGTKTSQSNFVGSNRYTASAGWASSDEVSNLSVAATEPDIATDGSGNALAVWKRGSGALESNFYTFGAGWAAPASFVSDVGATATEVLPRVASDGNGNFMVAWHMADGSYDSVYSRNYTIASGWGVQELVENDIGNSAQNPEVVFDNDGNAIAVWEQFTNLRNSIWVNRYLPGIGWQTPILLETSDVGDATSPKIAVNGSGNIIVVWEQFDGTNHNIYSSYLVNQNKWLEK